MAEHQNIGYYHGKQAARFRLTPGSFGYNPDYNFRLQAKRLFDTKEEVRDFLQAIEDYKNQLTEQSPMASK